MASKNALFLHGWPQYKIDDHFLVKHLKEIGYQVFTPNLFLTDSNFTIENIQEEIKKEVKGSEIDLIIGFSFGGIVLPHIALNYPRAKLVFIATGINFKPKPKLFNYLLKMANHKSFVKGSEYILKLPVPAIVLLYKLADPFMGGTKELSQYNKDMYDNISFIKTIPVSKEVELVNFAHSIDNTEILKQIKNESLVFSGKKDQLMPENKGEILSRLLSNSKLIINDGEHFDVLTENDIPTIDKFLGY